MDMVTFSIGLLVGMVLTSLIFAVGVWGMIRQKKLSKAITKRGAPTLLALLMLGVFVFSQLAVAGVIHAQTETLVPLSIPINPIMEQTNTWMNTFAAIGIGITLAIAILAYIGNMIKRAF